ncbi:uncharacterized protein LOC134289701 [Aedes albopictus]|uniref:Reverse transcriptase domain-containing protein n=1 Tax=Aedes albopictus TaxID=7160 RepID=A0ABM1XT79_AEDAL
MRLKTYTATAPRIYGAPKAHKKGLPLRPVVACMTSPTYELSKYVGSIIQSSIKSNYNVLDSFSFCEYINNVQLPPDYVLVSLDVVSLFTCIPRELVVQNVIMRWDEIKENTNINLDLFLEMTEFCINCSYFQFKGQSYQQVFGTAMGNPLSPIIADLVMETLLDSVTKKIKFPIPVIKKYVDDLMLAIPKGEIETVRNEFNQYHEKIQFTVEVEQDGKLPYLDLLVRKPDQSIKTEWYAKPIASGRFLNYLSAHSMTLKMNVAKNLIKRVTTFSTNVDEAAAKKIVHKQLRQNDYPKPLINRLINRHRENPPTTAPPTDAENSKQFRSIVNIGTLTRKIQRTLRVDYPEVVICPQQRKTVKSIIPGVKDNNYTTGSPPDVTPTSADTSVARSTGQVPSLPRPPSAQRPGRPEPSARVCAEFLEKALTFGRAQPAIHPARFDSVCNQPAIVVDSRVSCGCRPAACDNPAAASSAVVCDSVSLRGNEVAFRGSQHERHPK